MLRLLASSLRKFADFPPHTTLGMPSLSPTMTTGIIRKWLKKEGEKVKPGEIMFEVETDKATLGFEVQDEVYVAKILANENSLPMALGSPVAILVDKFDRVSAFKDYLPPQKVEKKEEDRGEVKMEMEKKRGKIAPSASHMLETLKIDPVLVKATGPKGLILKEDVLLFLENAEKKNKNKKNNVEAPVQAENKEKNIMNVTLPRFSVSSHICLENPNSFIGNEFLKALIIKAAAVSCIQVPETNSKFFPEFSRFYDYIDIQVFDFSSGTLKKYFIKNAQNQRLEKINAFFETESEGKFTFAISFSSLPDETQTPSSACLLSVGAEFLKVVRGAEGVKSASFIKTTLNCDHRAVDGASGANWLKTFKAFVENPKTIL